ncbi:MAG: hypothetical protein AAF203_01060 [Pseudomonadota bacterium]
MTSYRILIILLVQFLWLAASQALTLSQRSALDDFEKENETRFYYSTTKMIDLLTGSREVVFIGERSHMFPPTGYPQSFEKVLSQFTLRAIEAARSFKELDVTMPKGRALIREAAQSQFEGEWAQDTLIKMTRERGLYLGSMNTIYLNGHFLGEYEIGDDIDSLRGLPMFVTEVEETSYSKEEAFAILAPWLSLFESLRSPFPTVEQSSVEGDELLWRANTRDLQPIEQLRTKKFPNELTIGAEYGDGTDWMEFPYFITYARTNRRPFNQPPALRDYLMAENLLALATHAPQGQPLLFVAATPHVFGVIKAIENGDFLDAVLKKQASPEKPERIDR